MKNNIILDGWLDGYKLKIEKNKMFLVTKETKIDIKDKISDILVEGGEKKYSPDYMTCIVTFKNKDKYFIDKEEEYIPGVILVDFETYLKLLIYGVGITPKCLGIKNL